MGQQAEKERDKEKRENMNKTSLSHSEGFQLFQNSVGNYMLQSGVAEQMSCMCEFHSIHIGIQICLKSHLSSIEPKHFSK